MAFVSNLGIIIDMDDFSAQHYRFGMLEKQLPNIKCWHVKLNWRYNHPEPWEDEIDDWIDFHVEHPYCYTLESWEFVN